MKDTVGGEMQVPPQSLLLLHPKTYAKDLNSD